MTTFTAMLYWRNMVAALVGTVVFAAVVHVNIFGGSDDYEAAMTLAQSSKSTTASSVAGPTLILHVGPYKTATSSIQQGLALNQDALKKSNFHYLGKCDEGQCGRHSIETMLPMKDIVFDCILKSRYGSSCPALERLTMALDSHFHHNQNVIISAEEFCGMVEFCGFKEAESCENVWAPLKEALEEWNVRVVVGYRRYYQWLPSEYNQGQKPVMANKQRWKKREQMQTFGKFSKIMMMRPDDSVCTTKSLVDAFRQHFSDVSIFNMHQTTGNDVVANFVCTMIPEARKACSAMSEENVNSDGSIRENSSFPIHLFLMAIVARELQLLNATLAVEDVIRSMEEHINKLNISIVEDLPWKCSTSHQEELILKKSMELEKDLLPEWHALPEVQKIHIEGFKQALAKKKFCTIDADEALNEDGWRAFFRGLNGP